MQLAVLCLQAIAIHANLRFIDTIPIPLKESGQQRDTKLFGDGDQACVLSPVGIGSAIANNSSRDKSLANVYPQTEHS